MYVHAGNNTAAVVITTQNYPPGDYRVIFNVTDIYGQTAQGTAGLTLGRMLLK